MIVSCPVLLLRGLNSLNSDPMLQDWSTESAKIDATRPSGVPISLPAVVHRDWAVLNDFERDERHSLDVVV